MVRLLTLLDLPFPSHMVSFFNKIKNSASSKPKILTSSGLNWSNIPTTGSKASTSPGKHHMLCFSLHQQLFMSSQHCFLFLPVSNSFKITFFRYVISTPSLFCFLSISLNSVFSMASCHPPKLETKTANKQTKKKRLTLV